MSNSKELPPNILRTNHIPSPEEYGVIKSLISLHQERLLLVEDEVERTEATLRELRMERRVQQNLLAAHQALLTPMRRLIPDVLLLIFYHCHLDECDAPMRLVQVCRQWRELVLTTPTLWSDVVLNGTFPTKDIVPFARACAERSGAVDLRLTINMKTRRQDKQKARRALFQALHILAQHSHRWRTFEMVVNAEYKPGNQELMFTISPRLQKLIWAVGDLTAPSPTRLPFSSILDLDELWLHMLHPLDVPLVLQCTKLRNFSVGGPLRELTFADCWTILSNCPHLEKFDVSGIKGSQGALPKGVLTLPSLKVLRIGPFIPDPAPLIHRLNMPALTHLRLLVGKSMVFDSSCIPRLVHECRSPLESLSLVNVKGYDVSQCLPLLPRIKSLLLQQSSYIDDVILGLLERDGAGHVVCPELKHLGFRLCLFTGARLIELAKARRDMAGGLRVLLSDRWRYQTALVEGFTIELKSVGNSLDREKDELLELQTIEECETASTD